MIGDLGNKYFVSRDGRTWEDITTKFDGVKVLVLSGMNEKGDAQNVYTAQWVNSQHEDYLLAGNSVVRANVDLSLTFIVGTRYSRNKNIDTQTVYDNFVSYLCDQGDFYIRSSYVGKKAHVVCLKGVKPTTQNLHRDLSSYIMATATLHTLDAPTTI